MHNSTPVSTGKPSKWRSKEPLVAVGPLFEPSVFLGEFLSLQNPLSPQYIRFVINSCFPLIKSIFKASQDLILKTSKFS